MSFRYAPPEMFEAALEAARVKYGFFVVGHVVMPEHIHLAIKQSVARRLVKTGEHF